MTTPVSNLRINGDRLWDSLVDMAKIGPGIAGGNNRQTLTDEDGEGRALFQNWCQVAGCTMGLDQMGNMFARREGTNPDALPVYVGSHLDTQPTGGKYDGVLGVLGGLEIIRTLNDLGIKTKHPIVVTNWTNEEGTRYAPPMLASGVFGGIHTQDWAYNLEDAEGKKFGDELKRIGWRGDEEVGARKMHAFFELHIEQGPILEAEGKDIGVVTHGQGLSWTEITITGKDSHTGSTPMPMRKNAGLGMARVLELVDEIAWSHKPYAVGAAGHIDVYPNSRNVIPGKVVFTVDLRSPDLAVIKDMEARLKVGTQKICDDMGLGVSFEKVGGFDPVTFDEGCVTAIRNAAERMGYSHMNLISGAGHDACWINGVAPTAMVMCPCVDGLSHNEAEDISKEWATAGADVLMQAVVETGGDCGVRLGEQPNNTIAYICGHVFEGSRPAKKVVYDESLDIQVLCGHEDHLNEYELPKIVGLSEALAQIDEAEGLVDLKEGQQAILNNKGIWEIFVASNLNVQTNSSQKGLGKTLSSFWKRLGGNK